MCCRATGFLDRSIEFVFTGGATRLLTAEGYVLIDPLEYEDNKHGKRE